MTSSALNKENKRIEKIISTLENYHQQQIDSLKRSVITLTQNQEKWSDHHAKVQSKRIEELERAFESIEKEINRQDDDFKSLNQRLGRSIKLQESVIETKFKDFKLQNDLFKKNINELVKASIRDMNLEDIL